MRSLFFECIDVDVETVSQVFADAIDWLEELNMKKEADILCGSMAEVMQKENPFVPWIIDTNKYGEHSFSGPENKMIFLIYEEAAIMIREKYPKASIRCKADGRNSEFVVDDATYSKAFAERMKDE